MGMLRQLQADFVALGELAEKIWVFTRQNSGQPMAHELQDLFAVLKPAPPETFFPLAPPNGPRAGERGFQ